MNVCLDGWIYVCPGVNTKTNEHGRPLFAWQQRLEQAGIDPRGLDGKEEIHEACNLLSIDELGPKSRFRAFLSRSHWFWKREPAELDSPLKTYQAIESSAWIPSVGAQ
jgi:hypothetical protein